MEDLGQLIGARPLLNTLSDATFVLRGGLHSQVNGGELPKHVLPFSIGGAILAGLIPLTAEALEVVARSAAPLSTRQLANAAVKCLPSGISFAVGMYVAPRWTIPRVLGSVAEQVWRRVAPGSHRSLMVVIASGLVLGEGTAALITATLKGLIGH